MALLRGRARLGALTLAYPHTPPFPSWGRFEECAHTLSAFAQQQGQPRLCCTAAAHGGAAAARGGGLEECSRVPGGTNHHNSGTPCPRPPLFSSALVPP
eukprot:COSAG01_NODE_665_length_14398_cov_91.714595_12_plen_99_part_00